MKRIGILGGMGPQATIDLYQKIVSRTQAAKDQEHIPVLIDSHPQIEDRTAFITGKSAADPTAKLVESAKRLEAGGAQAIIMPCNTAHYFAPAIERAVSIPLLHIAEAAIKKLQNAVPAGAAVAVLATDGTQQAGIYAKPLIAAGCRLAPIDDKQQAQVMQAIYQGAKAGKIEEYAPVLNAVIEAVPADAYLLACTELPLFAPFLPAGRCYIDPTEALADAAIAFALARS